MNIHNLAVAKSYTLNLKKKSPKNAHLKNAFQTDAYKDLCFNFQSEVLDNLTFPLVTICPLNPIQLSTDYQAIKNLQWYTHTCLIWYLPIILTEGFMWWGYYFLDTSVRNFCYLFKGIIVIVSSRHSYLSSSLRGNRHIHV